MIFISYAHEDQPYAHRLFSALRDASLDPWMDKPPAKYSDIGLKIGQRWERVLQEKLGVAEYIILILSPTSVSKRGYVQVEFRTALERMSYLPDDHVLVLPLLTEECKIPSLQAGHINLNDLHWEVISQDRLEEFANQLSARVRGLAA